MSGKQSRNLTIAALLFFGIMIGNDSILRIQNRRRRS